MTEQFLSTAVQREIENVAINNDSVTKDAILLTTTPFYGTAIGYLSKWARQFNEIMLFAWTSLDIVPEWAFLEASAKYLEDKKQFDTLANDNELFDQFTELKKFVTADKIQFWEEKITPVDKRWIEIFQHFSKNKIESCHLLLIISFILCLPGTSATVERVFSLINKIWTEEKTQMSIETLKNILFVKYNSHLSCLEFFELLKATPSLIKAISSEKKYTIGG